MTRGRRPALTAAACVALGLASVAGAQDGGPIIIGEVERPPRFGMRKPDITLSLIGTYNRDETASNGTRSESKELLFEEQLTIDTGGYYIHPNFLDYTFRGTFGLTQLDFESDESSDREAGQVYEFDTRATFLRNQPVTPTAYARRIRSIFNRDFGPSLEMTTTTVGAAVDLKGRAPTHLEAFHTQNVQESLAGEADFQLDQTTFLWTTRYNPGPGQTLMWDYSFNAVRQSSGDFDSAFNSHQATLTHTVDFGPARRHSLRSSLNYYGQTGDFDLQRINLNEYLRLRHSDSFDTDYRYVLDHQSRGSAEQTQHRGEAGFTHRLYRSLVTRGRVGALSLTTSEDNNSVELYSGIDFNYRKRVPLGTLQLDLGGFASRRENDADNGPIRITGEARTFPDSQPIVLVGNNISPSSIVITDPSGLILYRPDLDYRVTERGTRIEIDRILGGRIGSGESVLIDYELAPQGDSTIDTTRLSTGGRYTFNEGWLRGLSFYGRFTRQEQAVDADSDDVLENSYTDVTYGTDYRLGGLTLQAERQIHDSTILPYEATRFVGRLNNAVGARTTASLNAAYTIIDYEEPENEVDLFTISAQVQHRVSRSLRLTAIVLWRDQGDEQFGDMRGFEQQLELEWRHRQTEVFARIRNSSLETETDDRDFQFLQIGFRRHF